MMSRARRGYLTSEQIQDRIARSPALRRRAVTCVLSPVRVCGLELFRLEDFEAWAVRQVDRDRHAERGEQ